MDKCLLARACSGLQGGWQQRARIRSRMLTKDDVAGVGVAYDGGYWNPGNRASSEKTTKAKGRRERGRGRGKEKERERVKNYTTCPECQLLGVVYMKQSYRRAMRPR